MGEDITGLSDMEAAGLAAEAIKELINDIKIPPLKDLGVDKDKLEKLAPQMAEDAIASGSPGNNPRKATKEEIVALYHEVYSGG
jgi:alcohol dehydrogenase class IV